MSFLRRASLVIGNATEGIDLSDLQFSFTCHRTWLQTLNICEIKIYNVSAQTMQKIEQEFTKVVLQCGYSDDVFGLVFQGTVRQYRRSRDNPTDTYFAIVAADGDAAVNFGVVNVPLAAGSLPIDHVNAAVTAMSAASVAAGTGPITLGYVPPLPGNPLPRGKVLFGMARDVLRTATTTAGASWSIQNGVLEIIPLNEYIPDTEAVVINSATGMVGLPAQTLAGIEVRVLMNPLIRNGRRIQLNNSSIQLINNAQFANSNFEPTGGQTQVPPISASGVYRVLVASHHGDTRGNDWYTDIISVSIDSTATTPTLAKGVS